MKKYLMAAAAVLILLAGILVPGRKAFAQTGSVAISNPGTQNQGSSFVISYTISGDGSECITTTANISVANGVADTSQIYYDDGTAASISGSFTVTSTNDQPVTVTISGYLVGMRSVTRADFSNSVTVPIKSQAQIDAENAAAEAQRQAEAAAAAAAAQSAAESQAVANSIAASQQAVNDSIAAEQKKIQDSKAVEEASINASVAESASVEESIKESEIEESLAASEAEAEESRSVAASVRESSIAQSEMEKTSEYPIEGTLFIPYEYSGRSRGDFLFASKSENIVPPEGYEAADLIINTQEAAAFRNPAMGDNLYLVYGMHSEDEEAEFWFYDADTESFIRYSEVTGDFSAAENAVSEETEMTDTSEVKRKAANPALNIVIGLLVFILGGAASIGALWLLHRKGIIGPKEDLPAETEHTDAEPENTETEDAGGNIEPEVDTLFEAEINNAKTEEEDIPVQEETIEEDITSLNRGTEGDDLQEQTQNEMPENEETEAEEVSGDEVEPAAETESDAEPVADPEPEAQDVQVEESELID